VAAVSGRVIVEDPVHLAAQAAAGSALGLTDHATPFDAWARRLGEWAGWIDWAEQVAPWLASEVDGAGASELKRVLGSDTPADAERREATARLAFDAATTCAIVASVGRDARAPPERLL